MMGIGLIRLRMWIIGEPLWMRHWSSGFHEPWSCICILWGGHYYPKHYDLFKVCCAAPNLGITRTWICRLKFAQRPIVSGLRFFNEPEIADVASSLKSLPEDFCSGFLHPEKIHWPQPGLNPRTLDLEVSTLPWDHRDRQCIFLFIVVFLLDFSMKVRK